MSGKIVGYTLLVSKMQQSGHLKLQPAMCIALSPACQVARSVSHDGTRLHGFTISSRNGGLLPLAQSAGVGYVGGVDGDGVGAAGSEKRNKVVTRFCVFNTL